MVNMVRMTKRCQFILVDGHKCNRAYTTSMVRNQQKYCEDHLARQGDHSGLVRSTNAHTIEGNKAKMREWVADKMRSELKDEEYLQKLELRLERLEEIIERQNKSIKKQIDAYFKDLMDNHTDVKTERLEKMIRTINNRVNKIIIEMEELE